MLARHLGCSSKQKPPIAYTVRIIDDIIWRQSCCTYNSPRRGLYVIYHKYCTTYKQNEDLNNANAAARNDIQLFLGFMRYEYCWATCENLKVPPV